MSQKIKVTETSLREVQINEEQEYDISCKALLKTFGIPENAFLEGDNIYYNYVTNAPAFDPLGYELIGTRVDKVFFKKANLQEKELFDIIYKMKEVLLK